MSNSMIDHEHVRVLVWAGLQPRFGGPLRWWFDDGSTRADRILTEADAASVGAMLVAQNEAAFNDVHEWEDPHAPYEHASPLRDDWSAVAVLKALQHYVYHAFLDEDHDEWTSNEAGMFCSALSGSIVASVPGWDPTTWTPAVLRAAPGYVEAPLEINRSSSAP